MAITLDNGFLLAIEGIDGAGKTTLAKQLATALTQHGYDVVSTKEPTNGRWGQLIRRSSVEGRMRPADELEAFIADREEHVGELILPSLEAGKLVIVDRYLLSTIVYQGGRGQDERIRENVSSSPWPDMTIILDLTNSEAITRLDSRGSSDLFEHPTLLDLHRHSYLSQQWRYGVSVLAATMPNLAAMATSLVLDAIKRAPRAFGQQPMHRWPTTNLTCRSAQPRHSG